MSFKVWVVLFLAGVLLVEILTVYLLYVKPRLHQTTQTYATLPAFSIRQTIQERPTLLTDRTRLISESKKANTLSSTYLNRLTPRLQTPKPSTWEPGSFCEDFLENTFKTPVPICGAKASRSDPIRCFWHPKNDNMATCTLQNVMVQPQRLKATVLSGDMHRGDSMWLMDRDKRYCPNASASGLARTMEDGDPVRQFVEEVIAVDRKPESMCQKFLAWYSLHKNLLDNGALSGQFRIVRISGHNDNYLFPEYEKELFPELVTLNEIPDVTTCFRTVVLVPKTYSTILFQCKQKWDLRARCFECDGRGLRGTSLMSFRTRVLKACGFLDSDPEERAKRRRKSAVIILRKPYHRDSEDQLVRFQRVLKNENELITGLRDAFPATNVTAIHLEDLSICEQIGLAHEADVLMGVHGAGLVHLWWLQEDAVMFELEPGFEESNPSFRMLSKLTGRRYHEHVISGDIYQVTADVDRVIAELREDSNLV